MDVVRRGRKDPEQREKTRKDEKRFTCMCKLLTLGLLVVIGIAIAIAAVYLQPVLRQKPAGDSPEPTPNFNYNLTVNPDSRLSHSFWGIDYTPLGTQLEHGCGVTQADVVEDLKILSQLTSRIRIYGMDCNQAGLVLNGLKELKLEMGVVLTLWVDKNQTTYERQYTALWNVLDRYGTDLILGVSVGNEAIYRQEIDKDELIRRIKNVKRQLIARGHGNVPVFTTEIDELPSIIPNEDMIYNNIHPFFGGTLVEDGAAWTWKYFYDASVSSMENLTSTLGTLPRVAVISEIGWPTYPSDHKIKAAVPSVENQKYLLDTFLCESNRRGVPYFWFEFKDEPWKQYIFNETRESYWGLFDKDRQLKHDMMPDCPVAPFKRGDRSIPTPSDLLPSS